MILNQLLLFQNLEFTEIFLVFQDLLGIFYTHLFLNVSLQMPRAASAKEHWAEMNTFFIMMCKIILGNYYGEKSVILFEKVI